MSSSGPYICLMMGPTQVSAFLFDQQVLSFSQIHTYHDDKSALEAADRAISELGEAASKITDTFFVFEKGFSEGSEIAEDKKPLLKKITDELNLKGVGFSVTSEVVAESLGEKDHSGFLLLNISPENLHLSLVKNKELTHTEKVGRSDDPSADFVEGLARLKAQGVVMPLKIFLFSFGLDDYALDKIEQVLLSYDWSHSDFFNQFPQLSIIKRPQLLNLVTGFALKSIVVPELEEKSTKESETDFGFNPVKATSFGVPIPQSHMPAQVPEEEILQVEKEIHQKKSKIKKMWQKIIKHPLIKEHYRLVIMGLISALMVLIGGFFLTLYLMARAEVIVSLEKKPVALELELGLGTSGASDLVAESVMEEFSTSDEMTTTGVKLVGDKAVGKVSILNKTTSEKTFSAGVVITSGKFKFSLDEEVKVASASVKENSSGDGELKEYGKATASVTASDIGADYNLAKDTEFAIDAFAKDSYSAVAIDNFSKGSSREIQVVSKEDLTKLYQSAQTKILADSAKSFDQKSENNKYYVLTGKTKEITAKYSSEVGDEVKELSLDLTLAVEAYSYDKNELFEKVKLALGKEVQSGYELSSEDPQILSSPQEASSSGKVTLLVNASSQLIPQIDEAEIVNAIKGVNSRQAQSTLESRPEIKTARIDIKPALSALIFKSVPRSTTKINLIID